VVLLVDHHSLDLRATEINPAVCAHALEMIAEREQHRDI
jgi:hypothetical protein